MVLFIFSYLYKCIVEQSERNQPGSSQMKEETHHALLTARELFEKAQEQCFSDDKYIASTGVILLQDAVELVFITCLMEKEADEEIAFEELNFNKLLKELNKRDLKVIKSGILKSMNTTRVTIKHHGQLADPATVQNYYRAGQAASDRLLNKLFNKDLNSILLSERIKDEEPKRHIEKACALVEDKKYFDALVEVRKAIYLVIEEGYSIEGWADYDGKIPTTWQHSIIRGGWNAPWQTRHKKWIEDNVSDPFEYIQIDHSKLRVDLLEMNVNAQEFGNLLRLTPKVFRFKKSREWITKIDLDIVGRDINEQVSRYCIDGATSLILKNKNITILFGDYMMSLL